MTKLHTYEQIFHRIQMYREVTCNTEKLAKLLDLVGNWSYAHRRGDGLDNHEFIEPAYDALVKFINEN